jgi:hypothetical protein
MADRKIFQLSGITTPALTHVLPVQDTSGVTEAVKVALSNLPISFPQQSALDLKDDAIMVVQSGHSFTKLMAVQKDGTGTWVRCRSVITSNLSYIDGCVSSVIDANTFKVGKIGDKVDTSGMTGLSANTVYYLASTTGTSINYTATEPSTVGEVYRELFRTDTLSGATILPGPGFAITGATSGGTAQIIVQDEGVNTATATTMNFVGTPVTVTNVGGVATVTITGGSGGGASASGSFSITSSSFLVIPLTGYTTNRKVKIRLLNMQASANGDELHMQVSSNSGSTFDAGGTDYKGIVNNGDANNSFNNAYAKLISSFFSTGTTDSFSGDVIIFTPSTTTFKPVFRWEFAGVDSLGTPRPITGGGARMAAQATTHVRFFTNGGTITGLFEVWPE